MLQEDSLLKIMRTNCCMFDPVKPCTHCFQCIGLINQKSPKAVSYTHLAKEGWEKVQIDKDKAQDSYKYYKTLKNRCGI